jgi:hypothetical protein
MQRPNCVIPWSAFSPRTKNWSSANDSTPLPTSLSHRDHRVRDRWRCLAAQESGRWISLFDGKTLTGWKTVGGHATFEVKDGAIVGTIVPDPYATFLVTEREFADFILEAEFKTDWGLNSGLQFRAVIPAGYPKERMLGYQYEIDPTDRGITGALNGDIPGRKGHGLSPTAHSGPPRDTWVKERADGMWLKRDAWNALRVECRGPRMRLWLNGHLTVDYEDAAFARGVIGLQIPQAPENSRFSTHVGKTIAFRGLRVQRLD